MRVLMLNNKYLRRGGEEVVFEQEVELLRANGCEVDIFEEDNVKVGQIGRARTALRTLWSAESYRRVRRQLQAGAYDVVHVHNFFPLLSPSVYYAARAEGVPVVQTLHQYRLMCPVGTFFRDDRVCEDCLNKTFAWPAVRHGCYRDSALASATVASMLTLHRGLGTWSRMVTRYVALSDFARRKFIEGGLPAEKVVIKPNFLADPPAPGPGGGGHAVFIGRLCEEKGIAPLLKAWRQIGNRMPLKIFGEGPLADEVTEAARQIPGVEYLGFQPREKIFELAGTAECIVVPSQWYEGQPVVIIEALALGTPVVVSRIGPMTEFVEHGRSGLLFEPGNADDLAAQIEWLIANPERHADMRSEARRDFEARHTPERNFKFLTELYADARTRTPANNRQARPSAEPPELERAKS